MIKVEGFGCGQGVELSRRSRRGRSEFGCEEGYEDMENEERGGPWRTSRVL